MHELKFFVITDTHFFKHALGAYGAAYEAFMETQQKCFAETEAINRAVFDDLAARDDADIVLIAGDLTFNGEKESHAAFSELLRDFQRQSGKKVFVVTAGHDMEDGPFAFNETGRIAVEGTSFAELYGYYFFKTEDGRWGMIDTDGNIVLPFTYDSISQVSSGLIACWREENGWSILRIME